MVFIYVLGCEKDKYYVGKTNNLPTRVTEHLCEEGSEWTKVYTPIDLIEVREERSDFEEDVVTLEYMKKYGIENVRGGSFVAVNLSVSDIETLQKLLHSAEDLCFKCGSSKHFVSDCPQTTSYIRKKRKKKKIVKPTCFKCGKKGHVATDCTYIVPTCKRCGKVGHTASRCFLKKIVCFTCGKKGHFAPDCPSKQ